MGERRVVGGKPERPDGPGTARARREEARGLSGGLSGGGGVPEASGREDGAGPSRLPGAVAASPGTARPQRPRAAGGGRRGPARPEMRAHLPFRRPAASLQRRPRPRPGGGDGGPVQRPCGDGAAKGQLPSWGFNSISYTLNG